MILLYLYVGSPVNLVPGNIIISKTKGTSTNDSPIYPSDNLYVDFTVTNEDEGQSPNTFWTVLKVDNVQKGSGWVLGPVKPDFSATIRDISIGKLASGPHTITVEVDNLKEKNDIIETNETDNIYTKSFTVTEAPKPDLKPYKPAGWSAEIVVSKKVGTNVDDSPLYTTDTLYVDRAVINIGAATFSSFNSCLKIY